ncbi:hypothetical protein DFR59_11943 [Falsibacillus pallidus]|uniref:Uncharacterized protein n=1 Tax=Falsibacillus pallidus TaxID=493781 RepID=A0A370G2D2_9BACI|nr:hypothetical protein DFR59_11943 [Falsibacillus pallidus]
MFMSALHPVTKLCYLILILIIGSLAVYFAFPEEPGIFYSILTTALYVILIGTIIKAIIDVKKHLESKSNN